jgi:hypothetical protein
MLGRDAFEPYNFSGSRRTWQEEEGKKEGVKPTFYPFFLIYSDISQKRGSEPLRRTSDGRF